MPPRGSPAGSVPRAWCCSPTSTGSAAADGSRIARIDADQAERLIADGVIGGGMIPKVRAALSGIAAVPGATAIIADGSGPDVVRRALEDSDLGTRIVAA